ncbi:MAG: hypothetical protein H6811_02085 [Phycisphaeraceae bacterium]|nr:hypothetical protein [Phycisphaeraceae bacterium]
MLEVGQETEVERGWEYQVVVARPGRAPSTHTVSLSWADHDHWSGGALPPSDVIRRVLEYVLERDPQREWPRRFDAATARRWCPRLDAYLLERI